MAGIFVGVVHHTILPNTCTKWLVDNGATNHMVSDKSLLNVGLIVSRPKRVPKTWPAHKDYR